MKLYHHVIRARRLLTILATLSVIFTSSAQSNKDLRDYYELKIYYYHDQAQEKMIHDFLERALLPGLHKQGIKQVGVFYSLENDTAKSRKLYVLTPYTSLDLLLAVEETLEKDRTFQQTGSAYLDAKHDKSPYDRMEKILLKAFQLAPKLQEPKLTSPRSERIYELRSYESATEKLYRNKVEMFNDGGEIALFHRLGFNAVFYGEVISGNQMPNLMYMTCFENKSDREAHWKAFVDEPEWKKMSALPQYQHNVSKADIIFLRPTAYSDY